MTAGDVDDDTNWEDAMAALRARTADQVADATEADDTPTAPAASDALADDERSSDSAGATPAPKPFFAAPQAADQMPASGGFRFESPKTGGDNDQVAGLDRRDEALLRNATVIGGRLLTAITLGSLIFYIYVGLSGGITDGFDRFDEPIEDIRITMAREGVDAMPDYGGPPGMMR